MGNISPTRSRSQAPHATPYTAMPHHTQRISNNTLRLNSAQMPLARWYRLGYRRAERQAGRRREKGMTERFERPESCRVSPLLNTSNQRRSQPRNKRVVGACGKITPTSKRRRPRPRSPSRINPNNKSTKEKIKSPKEAAHSNQSRRPPACLAYSP